MPIEIEGVGERAFAIEPTVEAVCQPITLATLASSLVETREVLEHVMSTGKPIIIFSGNALYPAEVATTLSQKVSESGFDIEILARSHFLLGAYAQVARGKLNPNMIDPVQILDGKPIPQALLTPYRTETGFYESAAKVGENFQRTLGSTLTDRSISRASELLVHDLTKLPEVVRNNVFMVHHAATMGLLIRAMKDYTQDKQFVAPGISQVDFLDAMAINNDLRSAMQASVQAFLQHHIDSSAFGDQMIAHYLNNYCGTLAFRRRHREQTIAESIAQLRQDNPDYTVVAFLGIDQQQALVNLEKTGERIWVTDRYQSLESPRSGLVRAMADNVPGQTDATNLTLAFLVDFLMQHLPNSWASGRLIALKRQVLSSPDKLRQIQASAMNAESERIRARQNFDPAIIASAVEEVIEIDSK